jgi:hypothetical protein
MYLPEAGATAVPDLFVVRCLFLSARRTYRHPVARLHLETTEPHRARSATEPDQPVAHTAAAAQPSRRLKELHLAYRTHRLVSYLSLAQSLFVSRSSPPREGFGGPKPKLMGEDVTGRPCPSLFLLIFTPSVCCIFHFPARDGVSRGLVALWSLPPQRRRLWRGSRCSLALSLAWHFSFARCTIRHQRHFRYTIVERDRRCVSAYHIWFREAVSSSRKRCLAAFLRTLSPTLSRTLSRCLARSRRA